MIFYQEYLEPKRQSFNIDVDLAKSPHRVVNVTRTGRSPDHYRFTIKHENADTHADLGGETAQLILHSLRQFYKTKVDPFERVGDWEWHDEAYQISDWDKRRRLLFARMSPEERSRIFEEGTSTWDA